MSDIGVVVDGDSLVLWTGRDFKWGFTNLDANGNSTNYPSGSLYFELLYSTDGGITPTTQWTFSISGATATLKVESTDADLIPARTQWQLVFLPTGEVAGGDPIAYGTVRRVPS